MGERITGRLIAIFSNQIVENENNRFIRVNELTEEQRNTKLANKESLVTCKNYRISLHRCGHLEGKPCTATPVKSQGRDK